ncbi:MAG: hypothetical protein H7Z39_04255 [Burkholderiaceae bacterium]|nr:hypothetical protein [Burkholderiaceae bacterium]
MEKIEEFMLTTRLQMQQLQDQIDAQQLVIAWLLSQLDRAVPGIDSPAKFLLNQSLALREGKNGELVAVFDALAEDSALFASLRGNPR